MNMSTFCEIKYMNGLIFFFKGQVYDWGCFQNTGSHTRTKITPGLPPLPPPPEPAIENTPGVLWNKGTRACISGEKRPNFEGNRETKKALRNRRWNREHIRKHIFDFWRTWEQAIYFRTWEQVPPPLSPLGGPSCL